MIKFFIGKYKMENSIPQPQRIVEHLSVTAKSWQNVFPRWRRVGGGILMNLIFQVKIKKASF